MGTYTLRAMFKAITIWKRLDNTKALSYRCFQRLTDGMFCVQSADYYYFPIREEQVGMLERQFLELFLEESPDTRSSLYPTVEEAIASYDAEFADDLNMDVISKGQTDLTEEKIA